MNRKQYRDELLSAYLDGELSANRQACLKAQLASSPVLRAELEAFVHTVALVNDLPEVKVPRNFILPRTAEAVSPPARPSLLRRAWVAPLLTAATSVASVLFIVVLTGDLLWARANRMALAPAPAREEALEIAPAELAVEEPMMEQAAEVEEEVVPQEAPADAVETELPVEVTVEAEKEVVVDAPEGVGELEEGRAPEPAPEPAAAEVFLVPSATEVAGAMAESGEADAELGPVGGGGQASPTATTAAATGLEEPEDDLESTPVEMAKAIMPVVEGDQDAAAPVTVQSADESPRAPGAFPRRVAELVLGLAALTLGGATIWAWLGRRH